MTQWIYGWKANSWKKADGQPVKNREDFERLDSLCSDVTIKWVSSK